MRDAEISFGWVCWACDALMQLDPDVCSVCGAARPFGRNTKALQDNRSNVLQNAMRDPVAVEALPSSNASTTSKKKNTRSENIQICPLCTAENPLDSKFCSSCGVEMESGLRTVAPGEAVLVSVRTPEGEGGRFRIRAPGATLGSGEVELRFEEDRLLEPRHARFFYRQGRLYLRDEGTLNGSYLRLRSTLKLESGDTFICGAQLLRYVEQKQRIPTDDSPVRLLTSPTRIAPFRIEHVLRGGLIGSVAHARAGRVVIGRDDADLSFQHDLYLSGHHACVEKLTSTATVLMDLGSKNGTFRRIRGPEVLSPGDLVFVGRQLFRIEFQRLY